MFIKLVLHLMVSTLMVSGCQYRSCYDHYFLAGDTTTSAKTIYPYDAVPDRPVRVWCEGTNGGGWTVIQRRDDYPRQENFYRTWMEYALGFGEVEVDHWLGLDTIHALTDQALNELLVILTDFEGNHTYALYDFFYVHDRSTFYKLEINSFNGTAGDSMSYHNGMMFSAKDVDKDNAPAASCAQVHRGAWWYNTCHQSNLNGMYLKGQHKSTADGVNWKNYKGLQYSLKSSLMMIRPKFKQTI